MRYHNKIVIGIGVWIVFFVLPWSVHADQWYDTLPENGQRAPLPESGSVLVPKDFDTLNITSSDSTAADDDHGLNAETQAAHESEETSVDHALVWWLVGIATVIVIVLVSAPLWLKRFLSKVNK